MAIEFTQDGAAGAQVARSIRTAILAGRYLPGEQIRTNELVEVVGASRESVREGLKILEGEGLMTVVPNSGAWVSELDADECQELYRMRERLEPLLLRMNMPSISDSDIDGLEFLADSMEASADVERFLRLDREFHLSYSNAAHTTVLGVTVRSLWNRTQLYRRQAALLFYADGDRSVHHDHHLIVSALRRRDDRGAEGVLAGHIRRSRVELARHPELFPAINQHASA